MISIVCPTDGKNPGLLRDMVESVRVQKCETELTVVCPESSTSDDLVRWMDRTGGRIVVAPGGASAARNIGLEEARGEFVAFIDDDVILAPDWSEKVEETFERFPGARGITGSVAPRFEVQDDASYPESLWWIIGCTPSWDMAPFGKGANMIFRRKELDGFRFDETRGPPNDRGGVGGEEVALQLRVGEILHEPLIRVIHFVPHSKTTAKYARRYAFLLGRTKARNRMEGLVQPRDWTRRRDRRFWRTVFDAGHGLTRFEVITWAGLGYMRELWKEHIGKWSELTVV